MKNLSRINAAIIASAAATAALVFMLGPRAESKFDIGVLDTADAIPIVQGSGARKLFVFESSDCGFCHELNSTVAQVNDVTVYVFALPGHSAHSRLAASAAWCARGQPGAWIAAMDGMVVQAPKCDSSALDRNLARAKRMGIKGTPTTIFLSSKGLAGPVSKKEIEAQL